MTKATSDTMTGNDLGVSPPKRESRVEVTWVGEHRFDTGRPGGPTSRLDGEGITGQSPVDAVLSALAACSAVDVVDIMTKRRTPVERLRVEARGERREELPRRIMTVELRYIVDGAGIDVTQVDRAIALSHEKYCSVAATLAPDLEVRSVAVVNGREGRVHLAKENQ